MSKPIEENGKFYRIRRGKKVEIPPEWFGKVPNRKQTINKRPSKQIHKLRKRTKNPNGFRDSKLDELNGKYLKNSEEE